MSNSTGHNVSNHPVSSNARDDQSEPFCTPKEAADYLEVTPQAFDGLRKQYGIGRYHLPREHDQIVYSLNDLDRLKSSLDAAGPRPATPAAKSN